MNEREYAKSLIDKIPASRIYYVICFLLGAAIPDRETADDEFCESLIKAYEDDPDPHKADGIPLEDCRKEWEI